MHNPELAILILAAGASTRMGDIKQLLPYKNNTLLGHAIEQAKKVSNHVFVVLGANSSKIKKKLPDDVTLVENKEWEKGMGGSISIGIQTLQLNKKFDGVLIMLADQPLIESGDLTTMIEAFGKSNHQIVATAYNGKSGPPAIFNRKLFPELVKLNADFGAQKLMEKHSTLLKTVHLEDKTSDIDTPKAYRKLITQTK